MKLMFPEKIRVAAIFALLFVSVLFAGSVTAQKRNVSSKKAQPSKKAVVAKKAVVKNAVAKKAVSKKAVAKKAVARKDERRAKDVRKDKKKDLRKEKDRTAAARSKKDPKKPETKRAAAERRRIEEERRRAAIAEQRRREQARREAIARKLAFERGLRTETVANISADNIAGEDLNIRRAAVEALGDRAGSVVVMEAQTGKILTIVNQNWAVRSAIRPCSTIKLVTAAAGLNEGVISKEDGSARNIATRRNLDDAIAFSDNPYFQRVGSVIGNKKLVEYGKKLGLGEQTGINLEGETPGRLPYTNNNARIYSHGDDTEVSTIQLAVMAAAITNGGHRVLPRIPRNAIEQSRFQTFYKANVDLPQQNVRRVIPGMMGAAEYGTARRGVNPSLGIAGKTGSCIDKGSWVGLFASVAPIESPKYAVAVITRGQRERGRYAAAVAGKIYQALSQNIVRTDRNLAQTEFKIAPRASSIAAVAADVADDDEADETDANLNETDLTADSGREVIVVQSEPRPVAGDAPDQKKLVKKTTDSKPLFPPVVITPKADPAAKKRERVIQPK